MLTRDHLDRASTMIHVDRVRNQRHDGLDDLPHALLWNDIAQRRETLGDREAHDCEGALGPERESWQDLCESRSEFRAEVASDDREYRKTVHEVLTRRIVIKLSVCSDRVPYKRDDVRWMRLGSDER